jgi:hypothetical protein
LANFAPKRLVSGFESRVNGSARKIKDKGTDDYDTVYIDLDYLLAEYLELYREDRKDRYVTLRSKLATKLKTFKEHNADLDFTQLFNVVKDRYSKT